MHLKLKLYSSQCSGEIVSIIDEECRLLDPLFLAEFAGKQRCELLSTCLKQPNLEEFVRIRIDDGVQPVSLVVDSNHHLVECDLIEGALPVGCRSVFYIKM